MNAIVVGVGRLGGFHAKKYLALEHRGVRLVALVDPEKQKLEGQFPQIPIFTSLDECLQAEKDGKIPAFSMASVATPTQFHHKVSMQLLAAGKHLLVEKPLTLTSNEGRELVAEAKKYGKHLAVGHVERHRVAPMFAEFGEPKFLECHRLAPFSFRSTDIDVILDVMIHDLDLMLAIVKSPLQSVHAAGFPVLTDKVDIANARFEFENGCVANLTASRISAQQTRKFRAFSHSSYLSLDLVENSYQYFSKNSAAKNISEMIISQKGEFSIADPLQSEVVDFVDAVERGRPPLVSGEDGVRAQELAEKVVHEIQMRLRAGK